jgi:hypothetical protein
LTVDSRNINLLNGGNMNMSGFTLSNTVGNTISMNAGSVSNVSNIVGSAGTSFNLTATSAGSFARPYGCVADGSGNIYSASLTGFVVRRTTPAGVTTTLAGSGTAAITDGTGTGASFSNIARGMCIDPTYSTIYIGDTYKFLRRIDIATGVVTTVAGNSGATATDGIGLSATFGALGGLTVDPSGRFIYASDLGAGTIRRITISNFAVTTIAGGAAGYVDGTGTGASFSGPIEVSIDPLGSNLYVADTYGNKLRRMTIPGYVVTTICGSGAASTVDGTGLTATMQSPTKMCIDPPGSNLYITDFGFSTLRRYTIATSNIITIAGASNAQTSTTGITGTSRLNWSGGVCVDPFGNIYVQDYVGGFLRLVVPVTTTVSFSNANLGIATATPAYTLDVTGTSRITSNLGVGVAPIATAGSINVANGYYVNGVQLAGGSAIATYSNSGAVLLADGTSTGLQGSSNLFFSNNTSLGIQTTTPATALDVNGGVTIRNGLRPLYSNVTANPLTVAANSYGTHFNITTSALAAITLPTITWASDSNAYWVFRNNTGTYLSITFTYTSAGTTAPTNPVTIPPANSVTVFLNYNAGVPSSNYVLF